MTNIFENKIAILKEFIEICNKNNLWYSLDEDSLLALKNNLSYWKEVDHYDVMMTFESYEKLRELCPNQIIDSVKHSDYFSLQNKFIFDVSKIYEECPFININLIIPTTIKKVKKYLKTSLKIRAFINHFSTMNTSNISKIKNKIRISKILRSLVKKINYKDIIDLLYDENYEGFLVTKPLINNHSVRKWMTNISYKLIKIEKDNMQINVVAEYSNYLKNIYGKNWSSIDKLEIDYLHKNIIDVYKYDTIVEKNEIDLDK